jgi:tetratricopeptide (TPR) repeat protein
MSGVASLFSVEFFQLARQRLRPGGIMVQWVHGYNLVPDDLRMVAKTFATAFPATSIWNTVPGDYLLLGQAESRPIDLGLVRARYPKLGRRGEAWPGIFGYFVLDEEDSARFAAGARVNTDDRLPLEFSAPRALYLDTTEQNWRLVRSFRTADLPAVTRDSQPEFERAEVRYWVGMGYLERGLVDDALEHFQRALQRDPRHRPSMLWAGTAHLRLSRPGEALRLAKAVLDRDPRDVEALVLAGLASTALRTPAQAVAYVERASQLRPQDPRIQRTLTRMQLALLSTGSFNGSQDLADAFFSR